MSFITVTKGGPGSDADIADGVYPVILASVSDPRRVTARRGPKAGQDIDLIDWTFVILDGEYRDRDIPASTSTASGPKSKMYAWLTALYGGRAPDIGTEFQKSDLTGRVAYATIRHDEDGWPRIENLGAMPGSEISKYVGAVTGAPVQAPGSPAPASSGSAPLREQVTAAVGDLPF